MGACERLEKYHASTVDDADAAAKKEWDMSSSLSLGVN
jgi:hypothetical protein